MWLRLFDLIWLMTQGDSISLTDILMIELDRRAFTYREFGESAAVGMVGLGTQASRCSLPWFISA